MTGAGGLTEDGFLGGRLRVLQPKVGFRSSADAVLLAAAVPARPGDAVLEIGCGAGVAALCLLARVPSAAVTGLELQPDYAALARQNALRNGLALEVVEGDLTAMPAALRGRSFDHVMMNPPYLRAGGGTAATDPGRDAALRERAPLAAWIAAGLRRLRPGGTLTLIQSAARLGDILAACGTGTVTILPVQPRRGRPAGRVIVAVRKGRRGDLRILAPLVLHRGESHEGDRDSHSAEAEAILRAAAPLPVADR
ncbi:MAG: methyltransferase [Rhodobacteraceae bacterium]|nr:methyltransferase [Paracoccaceae bacterium]